jgi:hypothetical protein
MEDTDGYSRLCCLARLGTATAGKTRLRCLAGLC